MELGLTLLVVLSAVLIAALMIHPTMLRRRAGKAAAFVAVFLLPVLISGMGFAVHYEHAKTTEFCVSCHVMEPYGRSLHYDDTEFLPAGHFQNRRVPREMACYTCHTQYTMFGDLHAKLGGLKHVWIYYTGQTPEQIELYEPFHNRECLHCHGESRSFIEGGLHADMMGELRANETSCLECHELVHDAANADRHETWTFEQALDELAE